MCQSPAGSLAGPADSWQLRQLCLLALVGVLLGREVGPRVGEVGDLVGVCWQAWQSGGVSRVEAMYD